MMIPNKVLEFLSESGGTNFTETAPRPPVYGEENDHEIVSNGGNSTKSSSSHKSQTSSKSHGSSKSIGSNRESTQSPSAVTPRRVQKDKSLLSSNNFNNMNEDEVAPLGYNPEGSESSSPPFTENSTPSFMKWAENLNYLLEDQQGLQLFKAFLEQEGFGTYSVDFWFACSGLKMAKENVEKMIKIINKKFIKSDKLPCIAETTKVVISEKLNNGQMCKDIFDDARMEVENDMRNNSYPLFIKSDYYVQYVQKGGESPKSSNTSSGSITRPVSAGPLPTLLEDQELETSKVSDSSICGPPSCKLMNISSRGDSLCGAKKLANEPFTSFSVPYPPRPIAPHPYHVSYAPVSAQDSEIQSLSSDALTDDTMSITDSSLDNERHFRKSRRLMRRRAAENKESSNMLIVPRTQRPPKDQNIAEVDPKRFAEMLIERLMKVLKERENDEKLQKSMNRMCESDLEEMDCSTERFDRTLDRSLMDRSVEKSIDVSLDRSTFVSQQMSTSMPASLMPGSGIDDDNPNSILEEHVSRIWERSNQQTPSRSPGLQSPTLMKKGSRGSGAKSGGQGHSLLSSGYGSQSTHSKSSHGKKRPDHHSSFDSGMSDDKNLSETHKHYHFHHHHIIRDKKQDAQHGLGAYSLSQSDRSRATRKSGGRKISDAGSNIDSGVSMVESLPATPNICGPAAEKVLSWIEDIRHENEYCGKTTGSTDTERSSSHTKRYRSGAPANNSFSGHKQGSAKKTANHSSSRSTSVERQWMSHSAGQALPSQPFVQDPKMPLPTPPNTSVQLDEVKRRLEETRMPPKSKSFTGGPIKKSSGPLSTPMKPTRTMPCDMDLSTASEGNTSFNDKKSGKKSSSSSANTSGSGPSGAANLTLGSFAPSGDGETVVGIFFCGEPIPYRHTVQGTKITLGQFKPLVGRRGNFKYFFKKLSNEFDSEVVFEEVRDELEILPLWEGKIVAKVEKLD